MGTASFWTTLLFAVGTVIGQAGVNVALPTFADVVSHAYGSPYFVVWLSSLAMVVLLGLTVVCMGCFRKIGKPEIGTLSIKGQRGPLQVGFLLALNGMMIVFASPSSRTAPYLQVILGNMTIPTTIIARKLILNKGSSRGQISAASLVFLGLLVCLKPSICNWDGPDTETNTNLFWPIWFMLGCIPGVIQTVIEERLLHQESNQVNAVWVLFTINVWQFVSVTSMFWVDIIPGYGMSTGVSDWASHMHGGIACFLPGDRCGYTGFAWGMAFIVCFLLAFVASGFLVKYSEGAAWQACVMTLVSPIGTLWWTLFQEKPSFHWHPEWANTSTWSVLGLALICPGILLYKRFQPLDPAEPVFLSDDPKASLTHEAKVCLNHEVP